MNDSQSTSDDTYIPSEMIGDRIVSLQQKIDRSNKQGDDKSKYGHISGYIGDNGYQIPLRPDKMQKKPKKKDQKQGG